MFLEGDPPLSLPDDPGPGSSGQDGKLNLDGEDSSCGAAS